MNSKNGFTLIELLTAMAVIVVVGSLVTATLIAVLRGTNKTTVINSVKQNGDEAMNMISKTIRDAGALNYIYPCGNSSSPTITSTLTVTPLGGTATTYACGSNSITVNSAPLFDTNSVVLDTSKTCQFICTQSSIASPPIIQIIFSLKQNNPNALVEKTSAISFQSSVEMRNLSR